MSALELKIPPPVVALLTALAMWGLARYDSAPVAWIFLRIPVASLLLLTGLLFDAAGFLTFRRVRTTINPMRPKSTSTLVQSGVYKLTRNPMYLGLACILCGWAVYLWSPWALCGPLAFVAYITRFQIIPEERVLTVLFGEVYSAYRAKVGRWL